MKKHLCLTMLILFNVALFGQKENIFHKRDFWKTNPSLAKVKAKIAEGNDPVALTGSAFDATVYAIIGNASNEVIQYLLSLEGNEVTKNTHDGRSYLMWAAYAGNKEITEHLIERGSDMELIDDHGYSALTFSATTGMDDPAVYDVLIKNGAKISDTNRDGANALLLISAHLEDDFSILDYFQKKGIDRAATDQNGNGLFNYAARKGNLPLMKKAIEWGLPYKENNKVGGNAVMFASRGYRSHTNGMEVYKYLEGLGLDMSPVTDNGETPLHSIAYRVKDQAIFEYFIKQGVDINQANKSGNTMLLNAVNGNNTGIVKKYHSQVADINHQNKDGHSALTYAVRRGQAALVKHLLVAGANPKIVDKKGNSLAGHLFQTFRSGQEENFGKFQEILADQKISFTAEQAAGNTLLHIAVDKQNKFLMEKALDMQVDINAKNSDGLTPIHLAAMKAKDPSMLTFLIEKGADKDIKTEFEESVYDLAAENELLKKAGFDLEVLKK